MKRILIFLIIVVICLPSCGARAEAAQTEENITADRSEYEMPIKMIRYDWSGYGVSRKTIEHCSLTQNIIDILSSLPETMEISMAMALGDLDDYGNDPPVDRGTLWLEIGSKIYRIDPEVTEIAIVERHLGSGRKLDADPAVDRLGDLLYDAWYYYPYDYYSGSYNNQTGEIKINNVFEADSTVDVNIKSFKVENKFNSVNTITLELISSVDQEVSIRLDSAQSDDNLAAGDYKEITLTKGKAETLELSFGGWEYTYWITITADNTRIDLRIEP